MHFSKFLTPCSKQYVKAINLKVSFGKTISFSLNPTFLQILFIENLLAISTFSFVLKPCNLITLILSFKTGFILFSSLKLKINKHFPSVSL